MEVWSLLVICLSIKPVEKLHGHYILISFNRSVSVCVYFSKRYPLAYCMKCCQGSLWGQRQFKQHAEKPVLVSVRNRLVRVLILHYAVVSHQLHQTLLMVRISWSSMESCSPSLDDQPLNIKLSKQETSSNVHSHGFAFMFKSFQAVYLSIGLSVSDGQYVHTLVCHPTCTFARTHTCTILYGLFRVGCCACASALLCAVNWWLANAKAETFSKGCN